MKRVLLLLSVLVLALFVGGAVALSQAGGESAGSERWTLFGQPEETVAAYLFIGSNRKAASAIPCYCGCWTFAHGSLLDCFFKPRAGYEEHASGCDICRDEARELQRFIASGQGVAAARTFIDAEYASYGRPTDTPPVEELK